MNIPDDRWFSKAVTALTESLESNPLAHACWIAGSIAQNKDDEHSDLDFWVAIDDDQEKVIFEDIEKSLKELGDLDINYPMERPSPKFFHTVFHFKGDPASQTIDMNLMYKSHEKQLIEGVDDILVIFDKDNLLNVAPFKSTPVNWQEVQQDARQFYQLQKPNIEKNIRREQPLEALIYYSYLASKVVEIIRMKYTPAKKEYGLKHVYRDLPKKEAAFIEEIVLVADTASMEDGLTKIEGFINEIDTWSQ